MMDEISKELNQQLRKLYQTMVASPTGGGILVPLFKHGEAERVLRIEIERECERDFAEWLWRAHRVEWFTKREGPRHFRGVDLYVVDKLPAPGWRIVNPFAERRA